LQTDIQNAVTAIVEKHAGKTSENWGNQLSNVIETVFNKSFQGVEVTADLVKDFLDSPLGWVTMFIVFWKVIGMQIVGIGTVSVLGLTVLIIGYKLTKKMFFGETVKVGKGEYEQKEPLTDRVDLMDCCFVLAGYCVAVLALLTLFGNIFQLL